MTSPELERLAEIGQLKREPPAAGEIEGLQRSGETRLADAANASLSLEGRFDLGYNAAHALALAALRRLGYRSASRYLVFQALPHTLGLPAATWRVLAKCHEIRNRAEYEGSLEVNDRLVTDLIDAARSVLAALRGCRVPAEQAVTTGTSRVTDLYGRRCAVTAERTLPVLQAAHIRPYTLSGPHDPRNGLLLRSDIHKLLDRGYVTVTPDLRFEVSRRTDAMVGLKA